MKIATIIGARPQFIKAAAVSRAIATYNRSMRGHDPISPEIGIVSPDIQYWRGFMDSKMFKFTVEGPYEIPLADGKKGQYIVSGCPEFWANNPSVADERGCYIFSMKVGKGFRPVYVGKNSEPLKKSVSCLIKFPMITHVKSIIKKGSRSCFSLNLKGIKVDLTRLSSGI